MLKRYMHGRERHRAFVGEDRVVHPFGLCVLLIALAAFFVWPSDNTAAHDIDPPNALTISTPTPTPTPEIAEDDKPLKVQTDLVTLTLTVKDQWGRYVSNLTQKNFRIFENGVEQELSFFSDVDSPASIGVIFDVSGSMGGGKIARSMNALKRFMLTSHPSDEYSLIAFNDRVQLLTDRTRDINAVLDKLTGVRTKGSTALYDAVYLGTENVTRGAHQKRALLIISDGQDNNSRYNVGEVRRLLKESDVIIYSVGINGYKAFSPEDVQGQEYLIALSKATGGQAFFPNGGIEFDEIFERIALELRHQYSVGYIPKDFNQDGKWRKLKAKVTPPRGMPQLSVQTRTGYYATPVAPGK